LVGTLYPTGSMIVYLATSELAQMGGLMVMLVAGFILGSVALGMAFTTTLTIGFPGSQRLIGSSPTTNT
jgi:hypothetical protein